jgi:hypothetical protein
MMQNCSRIESAVQAAYRSQSTDTNSSGQCMLVVHSLLHYVMLAVL